MQIPITVPCMIRRDLGARLLDLSGYYPVVVITGPRQ